MGRLSEVGQVGEGWEGGGKGGVVYVRVTTTVHLLCWHVYVLK